MHGPDAPEEPPDEGDAAAPETKEPSKTVGQNVILFVRDLAVAFLVVGLVFGVLATYTRVWPPVVVVESDSMQHSNRESYVGIIDTGDIVLVQSVGKATDVVTYAEGAASGYQTYGNFGDVIVFHQPGASLTATPIIHRAMLYVERNPAGGVDIPALAAYPGGWTGNHAAGCVETRPLCLTSVTVHGVRSWNTQQLGTTDVTWSNLDAAPNGGFLTKGDHNSGGDGWPGPVAVGRIVGKARGELPWFGLIKLTLARGETGCCRGWGDPIAPKASWDSLIVGLVVIIVGPFLADFAWGWLSSRRKEKPDPLQTFARRIFRRPLVLWQRIAAVGVALACFAAALYALIAILAGPAGGLEAALLALGGVGLVVSLLGATYGGPEGPAKVTAEDRTGSSGPGAGGPGGP